LPASVAEQVCAAPSLAAWNSSQLMSEKPAAGQQSDERLSTEADGGD
jgi:hypothetical protein